MSEYVDLHCTWGSRQADILCEHLRNYEEKVVLSGNPPFDLLAEDLRGIYEEDTASYTETYEDYVLVITNFDRANTDTGSKSRYDPARVSYQEDLLTEYISTVKNLAGDLDKNIVLRPHPRENLEIYREQLGDIDGVHIIRDGSVRPWIFGADAVVHKSSTTAIESVFLDTPVFACRPVKNEAFDAELPISVSKEVTDYAELYQSLNVDLSDPSVSLSPEIKERLKRDFHNIDGPVAAPTITGAIDSLDTPEEMRLIGVTTSVETRLKRVGVRLFGGDFVESVGESVFGTDRSGVRNKFPGLSIEVLESEIESINEQWMEESPKIEVSEIPNLVNTFVLKPQLDRR